MWLQSPTIAFYIHRSFSIVVLLTNVYLFLLNRKLNLGCKLNWIMGLLFIEILSELACTILISLLEHKLFCGNNTILLVFNCIQF
jgi:cytochrome c oxidase assembly protein subunit 15